MFNLGLPKVKGPTNCLEKKKISDVHKYIVIYSYYYTYIYIDEMK